MESIHRDMENFMYRIEVRCLKCGSLLEYKYIVNNTTFKDSVLDNGTHNFLVDLCKDCFGKSNTVKKLIIDSIEKFSNPDPHAVLNPKYVVEELRNIIREI